MASKSEAFHLCRGLGYKSKGTIIDATIVSSASRPRRVLTIAEDRHEDDADESSSVEVAVV